MLIITNRLRKTPTLLIVALLIFVQTACAFGAADEANAAVKTISFTDLKSSHWAYNNINTLVSLGGIKGYVDGTFNPEGTITYAELTSILLGATGNDINVSSGNWAECMLQKAYDVKIITKANVPLADASQPVTRETMAVMLANSAKELKGESLPMVEGLRFYVIDIALTDVAYRNHVNQCVAAGLVRGNEWNQFKPLNNLTRAEAATICVRLLDEKERLTPTKFSELEKEYKVVAQGSDIRDYVKEPWAKSMADIETGASNYMVLENGDKFNLKLVRKLSGWFMISYVNPGNVVLIDKEGRGIDISTPHTMGDTVKDPFLVDLSHVKYFVFSGGFSEDDAWTNYIVPNNLQ